jgi:hypothetical protein
MSRPLVTVKMLIAQSRDRGSVELPANALVTPAAADWLRSSRFPVQHLDADPPPTARRPTAYLLGDAADPYVQTLLPALQRRHDDVRLLPCNGRLSGLLSALGQMCAGMKEGSQRRGVIVVNSGAIASCVANRHAHVRAAIVTQPSALFTMLRELGINVLIVEKGRTSLRQAQAMIETFLSAETQVNPAISAVLSGAPTEASAGGNGQASCGCGSGT